VRDRCCWSNFVRGKPWGHLAINIHCNDVFFGDLALGEVMGISHSICSLFILARFTASVLALLAVPVVGMAPLPVSGAARLSYRTLHDRRVLYGRSLGVRLGNRSQVGFDGPLKNRRWVHALFATVAGRRFRSPHRRRSHGTTRILLRGLGFVVCGVLLFGGAWALGGLLQFLWRVTTPPQPPARRARINPRASTSWRCVRG